MRWLLILTNRPFLRMVTLLNFKLINTLTSAIMWYIRLAEPSNEPAQR